MFMGVLRICAGMQNAIEIARFHVDCRGKKSSILASVVCFLLL